MLDIKTLLTKILKCLYVSGKSGGWTYRKYFDGTLECWYKGNPGAYTCGTARGSWYSGGDLTFTYPIAFSEAPTITGNVSLGTSAYVVEWQFNGFGAASCQGRIVSGSSIAQNTNYWIFIHAIGTWGGYFLTSTFPHGNYVRGCIAC